MGKNVRVVMNRSAGRDLMNSPEMLSFLQSLGNGVASRAGQGFEARTAKQGRSRGRITIGTTDAASIRKNSKENNLLRALGGGA